MAAFLAMAAAQVVGGAITAISSASAARRAREDAANAQKELDALEANRQAIPNLSGQIQNQYANLQVATQSAEFQAEEADISLANTLDTLRATGMGAGGATALAQAALRSKREVGADIARQEAANIQARAAGAAQAQQQRIAQQNFEFGARENREVAKLDRVASQLDQARAAEAANKQAMWSGIASAAGAAAGTAAGFAAGEMKFGETANAASNATQKVVDPNLKTDQKTIDSLQGKKLPSSALDSFNPDAGQISITPTQRSTPSTNYFAQSPGQGTLPYMSVPSGLNNSFYVPDITGDSNLAGGFPTGGSPLYGVGYNNSPYESIDKYGGAFGDINMYNALRNR